MIVFKTLFLQYLLLPLMATLLVGLMVFIQKKNALASNRVLIIYILLAGLLLALPGFGGFAGNTFNPYWYLIAQVYYLILGIVHVNCLSNNFVEIKDKKLLTILFKCILTLVCIIVGAYLFTIIFNTLSPFKGYAYMSSTSIVIFPVPLLFYFSWIQFMSIPTDIYNVWQYKQGGNSVNSTGVINDKMRIVNIEFTKTVQDGFRFSLTVKAQLSVLLGDWFYKVIEDYNSKNMHQPIDTGEQTGLAYSWIFYTKPSFFHRRRFLDFDKSIAFNKINQQAIIYAKRVMQQEE